MISTVKKIFPLFLVAVLMLSSVPMGAMAFDLPEGEAGAEFTLEFALMESDGETPADSAYLVLGQSAKLVLAENAPASLEITASELDAFDDYQVFDSAAGDYISLAAGANQISVSGLSNLPARAKIAGAEEYKELLLVFDESSLAAADLENGPVYVDGVYYGVGTGHRGGQTYVKVVIENDIIVSIEIVKHNDTASYFGSAVDTIIADILGQQSVEGVDAVSGATNSSNGIKGAVLVALEKAKIGDTSDYTQEIEAGIFAGGSGTRLDPYQVATRNQFVNFAAAVNDGADFFGKYICLTADITLTNTSFAPIGGESVAFAGSFDGAGHSISGFVLGTANEPASHYYAGLFAQLDGSGVIRNLHLKDVSVYNLSSASCMTGGLVAYNNGTIDGCSVTGVVSGESGTGNNFVGALTAYNNAYIVNCFVNADIYSKTVNYWTEVGMMAGMNLGYIVNSYAWGSATGDTSKDYAGIGGIAGLYHHSGYVYNCYSSVNITSVSASSHIGAIVGDCDGGEVFNAYWNSDTTQISGGVVLDETQGIGTQEEALIENIFAKGAQAMQQASFANALNNYRDKIPAASYPSGTALHTWVTQENGLVILQAGADAPIEGDVLSVGSEADLRALAADVTSGDDYSGKTVVLTQNIVLSSEEWAPIGSMSDSFNGVFEGNGYVISGLRIGSEGEYTDINAAGLFGGLGADGVIRNLGVRDVEIYTTCQSASINGALVGTSSGVIENCFAEDGVIFGQTRGHNAFVGGLVGYSYGDIHNSYAAVEVIAENISASRFAEAGGLAGITNGGNIVNCYATGNVTGRTTNGASAVVGGFVGYNLGAIENCYETGDVASESASYNLGQFVGQNAGVVKNSYWNGDAAQTVQGAAVADKLAVESDTGNIDKLVEMSLDSMKAADFAKRLNSNTVYVNTSYSLSAWGISAGLNDGLPVLSGVGNSGVSSAGNLLTAQISAPNYAYLDDSRELDYTLALDGVVRANMFDVYASFDSDALKYEGYTIDIPDDYPVSVLNNDIYNTGSGEFHLEFAITKLGTTYSTSGMTPIVTIHFSVRQGIDIHTQVTGLLKGFAVTVRGTDGYGIVSDAGIEVSEAKTVFSETKLIYDINKDGFFNRADLSDIIYYYYTVREGNSLWSEARLYDINQDGIVDLTDLLILYSYL